MDALIFIEDATHSIDQSETFVNLTRARYCITEIEGTVGVKRAYKIPSHGPQPNNGGRASVLHNPPRCERVDKAARNDPPLPRSPNSEFVTFVDGMLLADQFKEMLK